jgi:hypothetical protein
VSHLRAALNQRSLVVKDADLTPDGVRQITLKAGAPGKAKLKIKAKGGNLDLSAPIDLDPAATLHVQLRGPISCLGARFSARFSATTRPSSRPAATERRWEAILPPDGAS